tara:strand:+ start:495 stop:1586 length:1092 start_codon:yes stop_codon:yes gene_type:complete
MKIQLKNILIKDLYKGYEDKGEEGVFGYGGKLDIRPPYQRNFIYPDKERNAVIDTVNKDFPLNTMYWAVRKNGGLEVIDGQQRIISICMYVNGDFSILVNGKNLAFHNLQDDQKKQILNYKLTVYFCSGSDSEKLEWFKTINIAGKDLTPQELRNAVYSGSWVTDAKKYFSKREGPAYNLAGPYLSGSANRQEYLETAIKWISNGEIEKYMSDHQHDKDAKKLWDYFIKVISWFEKIFTNKKIMKGLDWGAYYNKYKNKSFNPSKIKSNTNKLILDDEITNKRGIYPYLITGEEKHLSLRQFTPSQKLQCHQIQNGKCKKCKKPFDIGEMEADHITPWSKGGKTIIENCQMLCTKDHKLLKNK